MSRRAPGRRVAPAACRRVARLGVRLLVTVVVPLLGVTWLVTDYEVTLSVDGSTETVSTHARTVAELLERAGVAHGPDDDLVPPPGTRLSDGMVVELVHAREITLLAGDRERTLLVTALSVGEVLRGMSDRIEVTRRSVVRPARLTRVSDGMTVEVRTPVAVTVVAAGERHDVITDARDVAGVLTRLGIAVDRDDRVSPPRRARPRKGMEIVVRDVERTREIREVAVPAGLSERPTAALADGRRREIRGAVDGLAEVTERVVTVDGRETRRRQVARRLVREPVDAVVEVGTAPAPPATQPAPTPLAPGAGAGPGPPARRVPDPPRPTPAPDPQPDPQPEPPPEPEPSRDQDGTATGAASYYIHPRDGMTAAHRTLPLGTVVTVTNLANGRSVRVTVNDRGPYIDGRIIDLNEPAFRRIASVDAGVIRVRLSW